MPDRVRITRGVAAFTSEKVSQGNSHNRFPSSGVTARDAITREIGVIAQKPGSPGELQLQYVSEPGKVKVGDLIVTAGLEDTDDASFFPAGIPIGVVKNATTSVGGVITVSPAADLSSLGSVQVLTAVPRP